MPYTGSNCSPIMCTHAHVSIGNSMFMLLSGDYSYTTSSFGHLCTPRAVVAAWPCINCLRSMLCTSSRHSTLMFTCGCHLMTRYTGSLFFWLIRCMGGHHLIKQLVCVIKWQLLVHNVKLQPLVHTSSSSCCSAVYEQPQINAVHQ